MLIAGGFQGHGNGKKKQFSKKGDQTNNLKIHNPGVHDVPIATSDASDVCSSASHTRKLAAVIFGSCLPSDPSDWAILLYDT